MTLLLALVACGGSNELQKPHDPPAWPMDNLVVDTPRAEVPAPEPAAEPEAPPEAPPEAEPEAARDDTEAVSPTEAP